MMQQEAPKNMVTDKFKKDSENDEAIKLSPAIRAEPIKMVCKLNFCTKYLTQNPPTTYPAARHKNMNE